MAWVSRAKIRFYGGPNDGSEQEFTEPFSQYLTIQGPSLAFESGEVCHKVYRYDLVLRNGRMAYIFDYDEQLAWEGVENMGIRKHGVGEILEEDQDLTKEASAEQDWGDRDEAALTEENEG